MLAMGASSADLPPRALLASSAVGEEIARKIRTTLDVPNPDASNSASPSSKVQSPAAIFPASTTAGGNESAEEEQTFDALKAIQAQADAIARLVERYKQTLERLGRFFKAEDLGNPPGPLEIQQRVVESAHADADIPSLKSTEESKPAREIAQESPATEEVGINVLV